MTFHGRFDPDAGSFAVEAGAEVSRLSTPDGEAVFSGRPWPPSADPARVLLESFLRGEPAPGPIGGHFVAAVYDRRRRRAALVRDRYGARRLYYRLEGRIVRFGTSIAPLLAGPPSLDAAAARAFLAFGYTPGPRTVIAGALKVLPGHRLELGASGATERRYWDLRFEGGKTPPLAVQRETFERLLEDGIRWAVAGEPSWGVSLSGGLDSAAIALLGARSGPASTAFTYRWDGAPAGDDEGPAASALAERLGLRHIDVVVTPDSFWKRLEDAYAASGLDEPVLPVKLAFGAVAQAAAQEGCAALASGEGSEAHSGSALIRRLQLESLLPAWARPDRGPFPELDRVCAAPELLAPVGTSSLPDAFEFLRQARARAAGLPAFHAALYVRQQSCNPDSFMHVPLKLAEREGCELALPFIYPPLVDFLAALPVRSKMTLWRAHCRRLLHETVGRRLGWDARGPKRAGPLASWGDFLKRHAAARARLIEACAAFESRHPDVAPRARPDAVPGSSYGSRLCALALWSEARAAKPPLSP